MTALGQPLARLEGVEKVTGTARYAFERNPQGRLYGWPVQSTVSSGRITAIDSVTAEAHLGVVGVITHERSPHLRDVGDGELLLLQSNQVAYHGQVVALVLAESLESAREAAAMVRISYEAGVGDVMLAADHPKLYAPKSANGGLATDTSHGDVGRALVDAEIVLDATYCTPATFNNPMETHTSVAHWSDGRLDVHESSQGSSSSRSTIATLFSISESIIRVHSEHVGGGFGSKGSPKPDVVLAVMATMLTGRPVKVTCTRQMMFAFTGYRTPTISRIRLAADARGVLSGVAHDAISHTSTIQEFTEQTAEATRHMYAAPNRLTTHRVAALDVPTPRWMRAPGECPGMYALESAMDELAAAVGVDPIELRVRNEPTVDPESGRQFSSRHLVECLRRGAELFGWADRDHRPALRTDRRWLVGTGVAAALYPAMAMPSSARATARPDGRYLVEINATDIGTGARTVLAQVAADSLDVEVDRVDIRIGDSDLPRGSVAGGSSGSASWGWAVTKACRGLAERVATAGSIPAGGLVFEAGTADDIAAMDDLDRHAYGAHFVEVRVDRDSGEIAVSRMLGVFAAGRILNPRTARSQLIGGMTMGVSMALHEHGILDPQFGDYVNHDFASYHIASHADIPAIEVEWLDEHDSHLAPTGGKGIGEIGNVGSAAAVANAVWHATGVRVRALPIQPDALLSRLPPRR